MTSSFTLPRRALPTLGLLAAVASLAACGGMAPMHSPMFSQASLPAAVQVPAGHQVVMETVGVGEVFYECRDKADAPGQTAWVFAGPDAQLMDRAGRKVGRYYGPPATWESADGSKLTGTQLAVAPAGEGNLPYQLVKANPATGMGAMSGISHIQRVALKGGVAPTDACTPANKGQRLAVKYQADYIFWKAV